MLNVQNIVVCIVIYVLENTITTFAIFMDVTLDKKALN